MKKKGFTYVEILITLLVIGIITVGTVVTLNRVWQNNRIDICESEMRDMTGAFKSYFTDYGKIEIVPDGNYETAIGEIVDVLNKRYLPYDVKVKSISVDKKSVILETKLKCDPWNNKYTLNIYTYNGDDKTSVTGLVVIASNGIDAQSSRSTYSEGVFGDDVIAVVEPN